ncbi:MAG: diguanylate cyclase [Fibrobacterota bacterium]
MFEPAFYETLLDSLDEAVLFIDKERVIRYWNLGAEKLTGFARTETLGASCFLNCTFLTEDDKGYPSACKGACQIEKAFTEGIRVEKETYLLHREGHRVPVAWRAIPYRPSPDAPVEGVLEVLSPISVRFDYEKQLEEMRRLALLDPLTELGNRRYFEKDLSFRFEEKRRYGAAFGILFLDIDHFKDINDMWGHDIGDRVLRMISRTLSKSVRPFDILARWGGEEFVAIVINVNAQQLAGVAEKLRLLVQQSTLQLTQGTSLHVTISSGATLAQDDDTADTIIRRADALMYQSKQDGRNRVTAG